ncbi:RHS repeat-associated core domain-containing protein [Pseudomonas sp. HLMP]|uniref:RHS repeat-associated core domain-containing protein n=1 Tax=Pseudomonas sp. HLMP TaxID=3153767 RepID=UPI0039679384
MSAEVTELIFYQRNSLALILSQVHQYSFFRTPDFPLALRHPNVTQETALLAIDASTSVLQYLGPHATTTMVYAPHGHCAFSRAEPRLAAFNGEWLDRWSETYLLGNGHRAYSPRLMRFLSADTYSPFGKGGVNSYSYCNGDPVNRNDPTGHVGVPIRNRGHRTPPRPSPRPRSQQRKINIPQQLASHEENLFFNVMDRLPGNDIQRLAVAIPELEPLIAQRSMRNLGRFMNSKEFEGLAPLTEGTTPGIRPLEARQRLESQIAARIETAPDPVRAYLNTFNLAERKITPPPNQSRDNIRQ